jgi:Lon protease-like protein
MKSNGEKKLHVPPQAPVMVLPEATLFPHALMPLLIFEPRYRAMLAWVLEQQRMFCIAMMKPGITEAKSVDDFHHVAGLGLVRACVQHEDGTSHLMLQGLARVRFTNFIQNTPFRIAALRELNTVSIAPEEGETLNAQVLEICAHYRARGVDVPEELDRRLAQASDSGELSDVVAHAFIRDSQRRQHLLEQADVAVRLRALIRHLTDEMP